MYPPDDFRSWSLSLLSTYTIQQFAPLLALLVIPLLVLALTTRGDLSSLIWSLAMVLENLGLGLHWWGSGSQSAGSSEKRKSKKKKHAHVKPRAERIVTANGSAKHDSVKDEARDEGWYPGLANISGTYCFMNSTLQAMASLCYLQPQIDAIHAKAEILDVPTPVIDALQELLHTLNTPKSSPSSIRPIPIIAALTDHSPNNHSSLFSSREHQDAQELFQLLSECIKSETAAVDKEGYRDRGLGGLAMVEAEGRGEIGKSVFDGLTANRRSCMDCGYTEAVMHFAFDNWQLAVPRLTPSCQLEDCLVDYTRLELLTDCICRKCSMLATHRRLTQELEKLAESIKADPNVSPSKKKRAKEARKLEARVKAALDEGRIEDDLKGVKMEKVFSKASTKQAMIARPPPVLALHINRSVHYGQYAAKNAIRVIFPEVLDLTPFTTSGNLSTVPSVPISTPPPSIPRSTTPTPATYTTLRTIYRLSAVVCHYGQHSFGHYICFRRKPRPTTAGPARFNPPRIVDPLGPVRDDDEETDAIRNRPGHGWLRISDDSVRECGIETVLQEGAGAFMLYYERVLQDRPGIYPTMMARGSPKSSEETLKPEMMVSSSCSMSRANGSTSSLMSASEVGLGVGVGKEDNRKVVGPRVVRSVAPSRGRSASVGPVMGREETSVYPPDPPAAMMNGKLNGDVKGEDTAPSPVLPVDSILKDSSSPPRPPPQEPKPPHSRKRTPSPSPPASPSRHTRPAPPPQPQQPQQRIQTPQPIQPPAMVGLRA